MFKTHYSFRQATGSPDEVCQKLKTMGYEYAPIADINSTFGWFKWKQACEKHDLKPVFGVAINVTPNLEVKKPMIDLWSFYAIDHIQPVNELLNLATRQERNVFPFGKIPMLTYSQVMDAKSVLRVSGYKVRLDEIAPENNLFIGDYPASNVKELETAKKMGFRLAPMNNSVYVNENDLGFYEIAAGRNSSIQTYKQWI